MGKNLSSNKGTIFFPKKFFVTFQFTFQPFFLQKKSKKILKLNFISVSHRDFEGKKGVVSWR